VAPHFASDQKNHAGRAFVFLLFLTQQARIERRHEHQRRKAGSIVVDACRHLLRLRQRRLLKSSADRLDAVKLIQSRMRQLLVRAAAERFRARRTRAGILLQSRTRSFLVKSKFKRERAAAVLVQRSVRHFLFRRSRERSATTLQRRYRGHYQRRFRHTLLIQAVSRGHLVRKVVRVPLQRHRAALRIQRQVRRHLASVLVKELEAANFRRWQHEAATTIQCMARRVFACRLRDHLHFVYLAASSIQAHCRGYLSRLHARQNNAATVIQLSWRCIRDQQELQIRRLWDKAARIIQEYCRDFLRRKHILQYFASTQLQRLWRGYITRKLLARAALLQQSAKVLQRTVRGFLVRLHEYHRKLALLWEASALRLQCAWRSHVARRRVAERRRFVNLARAVKGKWRRFAKTSVMLKLSSATSIARVWRGYVQRQEYYRLRGRHRAAAKIQPLVRGVLTRKKTTAARKRKLSATFCQQVWLSCTLSHFLIAITH